MKKISAFLLSAVMTLSCISVTEVFAASQISSCAGWHECMYMTWTNDSNADLAAAYYKKSGDTEYTAVDKELVRSDSNGGGRVDIPGLAAGTYDIKVVLKDGTELTKENIYVDNYDRSGYAHFGAGSTGVGAYNNDGTPKDGAEIIYVTNDNKNTVTLDGKKGIVNILKTKRSYPLIVRFIGTVETRGWYLDSNDEPTQDCSENSGITAIDGLRSTWTKGKDTCLNMLETCDDISNVTIEGIGTDATILKWGFTFKKCKYVEARNLHFTKYPEDACSFIGSDSNNCMYAWLHNCTFEVGDNTELNELYVDDKDKAEGDGSTDLACGQYVTYSYNRFNNCHKTSLNGNDDPVKQYHITWHHNYFDNVSSRMPLIRQANMHSYNNYFYKGGNCIDTRASAWVFSEANYFENCSYAILTTSSSSQGNPVVKSYNDVFSNSKKNDRAGTIKTATDRAATYTVSENKNPYPNFDTNSSVFYYKNGASNVTLLQTAEEAKTTCIAESGIMKADSKAEYNGEIEPIESDEPEEETKLIDIKKFDPAVSTILDGAAADGENSVIKQSDGTYLIHDTSTTTTTEWTVPFKAQKNGVVEISGKFRPTKVAGKWNFIQVKDKTGSNSALSLGFCTDDAGSKMLALNVNGNYVSSANALALKEYSYRFVIDIDNNKVQLYIGENSPLEATVTGGINEISSVYMITAIKAADRDFYVSMPEVKRQVPADTLLGDTDKSGSVNVIDAIQAIMYKNGSIELDKTGFANADADPDGVIDDDDVKQVLKIASAA
ncbi:MAG: hypothetical protein IJ062_02440 [Firmicutes bacterium]|nr:hypothetical protein [Bacillota bacterium]